MANSTRTTYKTPEDRANATADSFKCLTTFWTSEVDKMATLDTTEYRYSERQLYLDGEGDFIIDFHSPSTGSMKAWMVAYASLEDFVALRAAVLETKLCYTSVANRPRDISGKGVYGRCRYSIRLSGTKQVIPFNDPHSLLLYIEVRLGSMLTTSGD